MSKYQKLTSHLESLMQPRWDADFSDIAKIVGFRLPKSAYSYPAWWSNQAGDGHSQSRSWQSIGWCTGELNLAKRRVSFFRQHDKNEQPVVRSAQSGAAGSGITIAEAKAGLATYFGVP